MLGYWNDPEATARVLRGGWLRTGDLACRDADGFIYVQARKNDLVKVQGFRLHPKEVEDAISRHFPEVRLIVIPYQEQNATRLAMFAVAAHVHTGLVRQLRTTCQRVLPRHKVPSYIEVLTRAPVNASLKLDRSALARRAELHADWTEDDDASRGPLRRRSA
jgi:acyl-CoA synthetase (AMP-forming)/AMP-acid ligase II